MTVPVSPAELLAGAAIDAEVLRLRPDYRALLLVVDGIVPAPGDTTSEELLRAAEDWARRTLAERPVEELPHLAAWREAYRAFGAKPQRTRNSLEALTRRSPRWTAPGQPARRRLQRGLGAAAGAAGRGRPDSVRRAAAAGPRHRGRAVRHGRRWVRGGRAPGPGEVVWRDTAGVTCRRWNWRQARRTQLREETTTALFILDALDPDDRRGVDGGRRRPPRPPTVLEVRVLGQRAPTPPTARCDGTEP